MTNLLKNRRLRLLVYPALALVVVGALKLADNFSFLEKRTDSGSLERARLAASSALAEKGVSNKAVAAAVAEIRKEDFLPPALKSLAYEESLLPLGKKQYDMGPLAASRLLESLAPSKDKKILAVNTGSGYIPALLSRCFGLVRAVGPEKDLVSRASSVFSKGEFQNLRIKSATLEEGWPEDGPYDVVLLGFHEGDVPESLARQMAGNGIFAVFSVGPGADSIRLVVMDGRGDSLKPRSELSL